MAANKPVFYRSTTAIIDRQAQLGVSADQFTNGANRGVASGAIGINTGDYDPKESDHSRTERWGVSSSYIGQQEVAQINMEDRMVGLPDTDDQPSTLAVNVGFAQAASDTAALDPYGDTVMLSNYTGKVIPADGWAWGFETVGGDPVPPVVDAGTGVNFGYASEIAYTLLNLTGTVTPGTDPAPTYYWVIVSGFPEAQENTWTGRDTLNATVRLSRIAVNLLPDNTEVVFGLVVSTDDTAQVVDTVTYTFVGGFIPDP